MQISAFDDSLARQKTYLRQKGTNQPYSSIAKENSLPTDISAFYRQSFITPEQFFSMISRWITVNNFTISSTSCKQSNLLITVLMHFPQSSAYLNPNPKILQYSACSAAVPYSLIFQNNPSTLPWLISQLLGESKPLRQFISLLRTQIIMMMISMLKNWARFSTQIGNQQNNMKRFYKEATFQTNANKKHPMHQYLITLDGKTIKTPYRNVLAVPSPALAFLLSSQFNRQVKHLKTGEMPMLALCRTAVDADIQGHLAQHLKFSIYQYLKTDTLLFHDDTFVKQHKRLAQPLIDNFKQKFDMQITPSTTLDTPDCQINEKFTNWIQNLNNWQLIGLETMTIWMKSTIAAFSIIDSAATPQDIQTATYLQEVTQMKSSGEVQEKIMDINQIRLMISCGEMLYRYGKTPTQL